MVELPTDVKNMTTTPDAGEKRDSAPRESRPGGTGPPREQRGPGQGGPRGEYRGRRPGGGQGRPGGRPGGPGGPGGGRRRRRMFGGGKVCQCCVNKVKYVDYKDLDRLRRFVTVQGKMAPRRLSGTCSRHQRMLSTAIKRARMLALLPFTTK